MATIDVRQKHAKTTAYENTQTGLSSFVVLWTTLLLAGGMLSGLSIARYASYNADMFDLGNMAQAIASVREGRPLIFTFSEGPMSRLALHVELIYLLLAPLYALWPDPRLLVMLQAALFALGAVPVYRMALRRSGLGWVAWCLAASYLFYPVAQTGVLLDIHGDTLAMPLLLFALDALDRRAWRAYTLWLALALSAKFYVALPVVALGLVLWRWRGERRVGLLTAAAGLLYGLLAFFVIRPLFTTPETSSVHRDLNYLTFYFGQAHALLATWNWRVANLLIVFMPGIFLLRHSWHWLLPGLPIAVAALLSTRGGSAGYASHHYGLVVPFILMAMLDGLGYLRAQETGRRPSQMGTRNSSRRGQRNWRGEVVLSLLVVLLFNMALVDTPLNPRFWMRVPNFGLDQGAYGVTARDRIKDRFLAEHVPTAVPLAVSLYMAPHVVNRETLYMVRYEEGQGGRLLPALLQKVDYVVADALFDIRQGLPGGGFMSLTASETLEIGQTLRDPAFSLVAARDGLLMFQRGANAEQALPQRIDVEQTGVAPHMQFGDTIGLVEARITPLGGRRFEASFAWTVTAANAAREYVAVSRLQGVEGARMAHLPSYALLPISKWQPGQVARETFVVELPRDIAPGTYNWQVGWYDLAHPDSHATDRRSQVGELLSVGDVTLP